MARLRHQKFCRELWGSAPLKSGQGTQKLKHPKLEAILLQFSHLYNGLIPLSTGCWEALVNVGMDLWKCSMMYMQVEGGREEEEDGRWIWRIGF